MKKAEKQQRREWKQMTVLTTLLGAAALLSAIAYLFYRFSSEKAYEDKWKKDSDSAL